MNASHQVTDGDGDLWLGVVQKLRRPDKALRLLTQLSQPVQGKHVIASTFSRTEDQASRFQTCVTISGHQDQVIELVIRDTRRRYSHTHDDLCTSCA